MLFKLPFLTALAAVSVIAAPSVGLDETSPRDLEVRAMLEQRACDTPNGAIFLYQQPNYGGNATNSLILTPYSPQAALCTLFSPKFRTGFSLRSYIANQIFFVGYTSKDCSGNAAVLITTKGKDNTQNTNVNFQGLNSFQAVYYQG